MAAVRNSECPDGGGGGLCQRSLVVQDNVRPPDDLRGDADGSYILVVVWVPAEFVIVPLLQENSGCFHFL